VPELIGALDALGMSSVTNSEGMPTVILEAMAAGVPVAATDVGATRELIDDARGGRVVAPCDPPALAAALLDVLGPRSAGYVAVSRARVDAEFSREHLADLLAESFAIAVAHRARRR
jgi:glycosyltransferase involved in cell wall biosynthesis